jgi:crossover junction endodeoxyribonuclease RuvC
VLLSARQFVGIDPGRAGGIVVLDGESRLLHAETLPWRGEGRAAVLDVERIVAILEGRWSGAAPPGWEPVATLERPATRPTESRTSAKSVGVQLGALTAVLATLRLPMRLVDSQEWSPWMLRGIGASSHEQRKSAALVRAKELWPRLELARKRDDGLADAALLAEYGRQVHLGALHSAEGLAHRAAAKARGGSRARREPAP